MTVATPDITPNTGSFAANQTVVIPQRTPDAAIYYTTDTTAPDDTKTLYSGPFVVTAGTPTRIRAIAYKTGWTTSAEATASDITITIADPTEYPLREGLINTDQTITVTPAVTGSLIRYTTDGTNPTSTNGILYGEPFTISGTKTVRVREYKTFEGNVSMSDIVVQYLYDDGGDNLI